MRSESHTGAAGMCSHHDRQDTFIRESLQSLFDGNDAGDHAEGHGNYEDVVGGDAIGDESGEHEGHDEAHEDQLPPLGQRIILVGEDAHVSSEKIHRTGLRLVR